MLTEVDDRGVDVRRNELFDDVFPNNVDDVSCSDDILVGFNRLGVPVENHNVDVVLEQLFEDPDAEKPQTDNGKLFHLRCSYPIRTLPFG